MPTEEAQLAELLSPEAGLTSEIELKAIRNELLNYTYKQNGNAVKSQKVQVIFQSKIAEQYCVGIAKTQKHDKAELKQIQDRFQTGTTWKYKAIKLLNEKPAFVHTTVGITIDLRKSQAQAMLQSTSFPEAPVPTCTIADILQLQEMQRFDLMAIPAQLIDERASATDMRIADATPWSLEAQARGFMHGHEKTISVPRTSAARLKQLFTNAAATEHGEDELSRWCQQAREAVLQAACTLQYDSAIHSGTQLGVTSVSYTHLTLPTILRV